MENNDQNPIGNILMGIVGGGSKPVEHARSGDALTVAQAADLLGVSKATVYGQIRNGEINHYKLGKRVLISRATIDAIHKPDEAMWRTITRKVLQVVRIMVDAGLDELDREEARERSRIEMRKWRQPKSA